MIVSFVVSQSLRKSSVFAEIIAKHHDRKGACAYSLWAIAVAMVTVCIFYRPRDESRRRDGRTTDSICFAIEINY